MKLKTLKDIYYRVHFIYFSLDRVVREGAKRSRQRELNVRRFQGKNQRDELEKSKASVAGM